jgi:MoaA/NifB/PqqE/SkfB family radical SAM enzyme
MLTGGEPLLHSNLWSLCDRLRAEGISITLVTTGLLAARWAPAIASRIDTVVISLDGPPAVHDLVRRVPHGFDKLAAGVQALRAEAVPPRLIARSVVQRANYAAIAETIATSRRTGFDEISFLAADVSSAAFNRPTPWPETRVAEVAIPPGELPVLSAAIDEANTRCAGELTDGFVVGGISSLRRIYDYYAAVAGLTSYPRVRCNAPWISAVLEPDGVLRPCFFHAAYAGSINGDFESTLNGPEAVRFRNELDVARNDTCRRCVCSLNLRPGADV